MYGKLITLFGEKKVLNHIVFFPPYNYALLCVILRVYVIKSRLNTLKLVIVMSQIVKKFKWMKTLVLHSRLDIKC